MPIDDFDGAPVRLNCRMSKNRFNNILKALQYTDKAPPPYSDKFQQVRQMVKGWNNNVAKNFHPGWISCLDESMSSWKNEWTCPGWIFVHRKPHPMGNEYHSVCCGLSNMVWAIELMEGKDALQYGRMSSLERNPKQSDCFRVCALLSSEAVGLSFSTVAFSFYRG
jgi:hypothetical protein